MKTRCLHILLFAGLFLSAVASAQAEFVQTITIRATGRRKGTTNDTGTITIERMKTQQITTKDVLAMLGTATTNDFTGATLVSIDLGAAFQVRRGTNILADVSNLIADETSDDAYDDVFDNATGRENFHAFWTRTFTVDAGPGD